MTWIYLWPTWAIIVFEIAVFTVPAVLGHMLVRRLLPHHQLARHNDVTGFVSAIVGVVYAVLLAFVVIIAWESFGAAESNAQAEVSAVSDLYRLSSAFKDVRAQQLQREIVHYAKLMQDEEWPAMQTGGESAHARASAGRIGDLAVAMIDGDARQRTAVDESVLSFVRTFQDARRTRLSQNSEGIPNALWAGLIVGAILTIGFTYLFGVESGRMQLVMTGLMAAIIGLMFAMIVALDYPYRGVTSISPEIWSLRLSYFAVPTGSEVSFVYTGSDGNQN